MWGEVLRTAAYILNQVSSKSMLKTPYELCAAEAWLGPITHSQRNLILKPLMVSLLAIALDQGVADFIVHLIPPGTLSQTGMYTLKMKLMLIPILCLMRYFLEKSML